MARRSASPETVKRMADLLRAGAAMLPERCPICGLPLFRLRSGEIVCPVHGRVYVVRSDSEAVKVTVQGVLEEVERVAAERISAMLEEARRGGGSPRELEDWLAVLERTERILSMIRAPRRHESSGGGGEHREAGR